METTESPSSAVVSKDLSVLFVYPKGDALAAKIGLIPRPDNLDWRIHALPVFRGLEQNNSLRVVDIAIDTMPLTTVDQIVDQSGLRAPDVMIFDARAYGVPVLYGALHTLRKYRPVLVFSIYPPGTHQSHDTVEHYMRFVGLMTDVHYWLVSRPSTFDYVMQYAEVLNA